MTTPQQGTKLTVLFRDRNKGDEKPITVVQPEHEYLRQMNQRGYGIFETVNEFTGGRRIGANLSRLCAVYADLDVCKDGDDLSEEEREKRKERLWTALMGCACPPTRAVFTKNGLQPFWDIEEVNSDEGTQGKYSRVIEGVIEWTKPHGNIGDPVKDVARVLRTPGYHHMKSDPYLVTERAGSNRTYTLDELGAIFRVQPEAAPQQPTKNQSKGEENPVFREINNLDIERVVIDVWAEKGCEAVFDKNGHLIIDGEDTATFKGRKGDGNYMATTSADYPAKGNAITYVAQTLEINNKQAFQWLLQKYNLQKQAYKNASETEKIKILFADEDTRKVAALKLAKLIVREHNIRTMDGEKNRQLYLYRHGMYVTGTSILRKVIQDVLQEYATNYYKNEIIDKVKDLTLVDRSEFEVNSQYINLANGVFDIKARELLPHSPDFPFLHQLPVKYDAAADCPLIKKFLSEILPAFAVAIIQEWLGYCLYRLYFIKKALICVGERDTGKTTFLKVLTALIGSNNVTAVSLQKLTSDKFATASLYQKHVNAFDDLSAKDIKDNGAFKMITGGGDIPAEQKFRDPFVFRNYAKQTFSCNQIPSVADTNDDAYFMRFIIIEFIHQIDKSNVDKFLTQKLTTSKELSGLFNWALEGLYRLLANQEFSYDQDPEDIKTQMMRSGSPIANFAYDCLEECKDAWVSKEELYQRFAVYAQEKHLPVSTMQDFGRKLPKYAQYVNDSKKSQFDQSTRRNKQVTGWRNVRIKETESDDLEADPAAAMPPPAASNPPGNNQQLL